MARLMLVDFLRRGSRLVVKRSLEYSPSEADMWRFSALSGLWSAFRVLKVRGGSLRRVTYWSC